MYGLFSEQADTYSICKGFHGGTISDVYCNCLNPDVSRQGKRELNSLAVEV